MISATRCALTAGCVVLFGCGAHPTGGRTTQVPASTTDAEQRLGLTRTHPRRYVVSLHGYRNRARARALVEAIDAQA
jgi:phage replication-related protein YjqB (UPF0714/DUF867 family)